MACIKHGGPHNVRAKMENREQKSYRELSTQEKSNKWFQYKSMTDTLSKNKSSFDVCDIDLGYRNKVLAEL